MKKLISWTGWTERDWRAVRMDAIWSLVLSGIIILDIITVIAWFGRHGVDSYFGIMIFLMGFIGFVISIKVSSIKEALDERNYQTRPSQSSKPLHIDDGYGIDRRYQVVYRKSSRV